MEKKEALSLSFSLSTLAKSLLAEVVIQSEITSSGAANFEFGC